MYTASSSPNDTADEPITSCSNCNQTISYIKAAHPLPASSSNRIGTAAITLHRSEPAQEATRQKKTIRQTPEGYFIVCGPVETPSWR